MKMQETGEMTLPHNLPNGEFYVKKLKKLLYTVKELGGTVYDIAADSGFLSACHYLELAFDEQVSREKLLPQDMTVVTEVYVCYPGTEETERIFLYSMDADKDRELIREGQIRGGKLIIEYGKLKALHAKGYRCIYHDAEGPCKDAGAERFKDVFQWHQQRMPFNLWDDDFCFVGNGFNRALVVNTVFGAVFVMPDLYAVEESIRAVHGERMVREKYEADFSLERIEPDGYIIGELGLIRLALFGRREMKEYEKFPDSYRRLTCQVACLKVHYLKIYETVWDDDFVPEDEVPGFLGMRQPEETILGVSLSGYGKCYAICPGKRGAIRRVPNMERPYDTPFLKKYEFKGYGNILSAGVAASRIAMTLKNMVQSAEMLLNVEIKKVYLTDTDGLPGSDEIQEWMKKRRAREAKKNNVEGSVDLIAYAEMPHENADGRGILDWAAKLAGLSDMEYIDPLTAMLTAFEKVDERDPFRVGEIILLYEFSEEKLAITLVRKSESADYEVIATREEIDPESQVYEESELDEDEYNPNLEWVLGSALESFMMNAGLRALGIYGENETDEEAFEELRNSAPRVKRQFRRNDKAKVFFNNGYLSMMEEYPIDLFEECFRPILKRNETVLRDVISKAGISTEEIGRVCLTGSECAYPFVRKSVEAVTGKQACLLEPFECVAARGAALMEWSL